MISNIVLHLRKLLLLSNTFFFEKCDFQEGGGGDDLHHPFPGLDLIIFPFVSFFSFLSWASQRKQRNGTWICHVMRHIRLFTLLLKVLVLLVAHESAEGIRLHFVPHSHDDVGWLKTPAQYYYGWNNTIQHANVRLIYDSVMQSLEGSPTRKFTVVEIAFFSKWFAEQSATKQQVVKELVAAGRIEFAGGGWCSHDEATPIFVDMLDQVTLGHSFILEQFGEGALPKVQWQVDPFGHSAGEAMLFSQDTDTEAIHISRIDYQDFSNRQRLQTREFLWAPSLSLGAKAVLFGSQMLHGTYCPPIDFNFDVLLSVPTVAEPACDEREGTASCRNDPTNSAISWKNKFMSLLSSDWSVTAGDNVMLPMGCDFTYMQSLTWFSNIERLMAMTQLPFHVSMEYSTPLTYSDAKMREIIDGHIPITMKHEDFLPYADGPHMYWTGFYASRPSFKRLVRRSSALFTALRQIKSLSTIMMRSGGDNVAPDGLFADLDLTLLREAMAQSQHHDAVTGTAKQHVSFDYTKFVANAIDNATAQLSGRVCASVGAECSHCQRINESICNISADPSQSFTVVGWNSYSSGLTNSLTLRLPVGSDSVVFEVLAGFQGSVSDVAMIANDRCPTEYDGVVQPAADQCAPFTAVVRLSAVPSMSPIAIRGSVERRERERNAARTAETLDSVLETQTVRLVFDASGTLQAMLNKRSGVATNVSLVWCWYQGSRGNNQSAQASGAYIFRPTSDICEPLLLPNSSFMIPFASRHVSPTLIVMDQQVTPWLGVRWYVYGDDVAVEVEYFLSELPTPNDEGRELVMKWRTGIQSGDTFWTDSNGLELMERRRNTRRDFPFRQTEPVAGNYYPVTTAAMIRDTKSQLSVHVDATVGGSSLAEGELELMIHRRLLVDDGRGVGEALNETASIHPYTNCEWSEDCGQHYGPPMSLGGRVTVTLEHPSNATWRARAQRVSAAASAVLLVGHGNISLNDFQRLPGTWNLSAIPIGVEVVSLDVNNFGRVDVRLAHQDSCYDFADCQSKMLTLNLTSLVPSLISAQRMLLTFSKNWNTRTQRWQRYAVGKFPHLDRPQGELINDESGNSLLTMYPMEVVAVRLRI